MYWRETPAVPSTLPLASGVLAALRPDDRILDCGCGAGRVLAELAGQGLGRFHCGLDINPPSLGSARDRGFPVARADLTDPLPLADASVDACCLQAVLTCLVPAATRLAVLRQVRRVTRRVLAVGDFLQNWDLPLYRQRYEAGLLETGEAGSFVVREAGRVLYAAHHFTVEELTALLAEAGFAVDSLETPLVRTRSGNVVRGILLSARAI
jgi:SAM-dependent methyltransferase